MTEEPTDGLAEETGKAFHQKVNYFKNIYIKPSLSEFTMNYLIYDFWQFCMNRMINLFSHEYCRLSMVSTFK